MLPTKDGQEGKYYYRYTFVQERKESPEDEESRAHARALVNEILELDRREDESGNVVSG